MIFACVISPQGVYGVEVWHLIEGEYSRVEADHQQVRWLVEGGAGHSRVLLGEQVPTGEEKNSTAKIR